MAGTRKPPIEKKRKHHDVWQAYLKAWTRRDKIFCLKEGKVFETGLMGVANRRDFYKPEPLAAQEIAFIKKLAIDSTQKHLQKVNQGWLDTLTLPSKIMDLVQRANPGNPSAVAAASEVIHNFEEDFHARLESEAVGHLNALRNRDASFFADDRECADFVFFVCEQYMRTAKMQQAVLAAAGDFRGLRLDRMWKILRHIYASNIAWVIYAERADWRLIFLDNPSARTFVTGDQPIVNTYAMASPGEEATDLEFYYPLSPRLALLISKKPAVANGACVTLDQEQVDRYNSYMVQSSYEQVYADSREILEQIHAGFHR